MMRTGPNNPDKLAEAPDTKSGELQKNFKRCARCGEIKPVSHFLRRTAKRSGKGARRGTCRGCRAELKRLGQPASRPIELKASTAAAADKPVEGTIARPLMKRALPAPPASAPASAPDASVLRPNREGKIRMRGRTDKGSRWHQEVDLELAVTLVKEHAAVVVNRHTIRRLYSNKAFRRYILTRDRYTCFFCGAYGDTIDHLLPKAKGGHTTPLNCVCACSECNQSKADRSLEDFTDGR
ncbi:HNH endonuclease [Paenibacillus sp. A14]|uniref:HNH endonuclease n=1 Tax=Paenibacillus sp. A14 TaxID=3119820 RepID=UPI002FE0EF70